MVFLKLLLSCGLTFFAATAYLTSSQINEKEKQNKLNYTHNMIVHRYNISITPRIEQNIFYGESNVSIQLSATTSKIKLYSEVKYIYEIWLSDSPPRYRYNNEEMIVYKPIKPIKPLYNPGMEFIELIFANELSPGHYSLNMKFYSIIANDTNLTTFYKGKDNWWLMPTHFHILGGRRLFPCLGEFISTTYDITIQHHRNYWALSNMPVVIQGVNDEDIMFTRYQITPVLPTYLLAGIVTNFTCKAVQSVYLVTMCYKNSSESRLTFAYDVIKDVTFFWKRKAWKDVRAHHTVDHLVIPHFQDVGIVNLGLILYRESDIMYDKILDPVVRKNEVAQVIVHKMIKEFILHDIHPSSPFWFVDGLLRFCGTVILHEAIPASRIIDLFVVQQQRQYLHIDTSYDMSNFNWSSTIPHVKVIIMMRMLQYGLPEPVFWNGTFHLIKDKVLSQHKLSPLMDKYLSKSEIGIKEENKLHWTNMINKTDKWINQRTYTVNVLHYKGLQFDKIMITLNLKNYNKSINPVYAIPVNCITQKVPNFSLSDARFKTRFIEESMPSLTYNLNYEEDGWVIANIQQTGYYRVNYEDTNWIKISDYLNLPDQSFEKIHVLNRAQIIDDAFHFMIINQLDSDIFWNITHYLRNEIDYVAWYPMFKALEYMSSVIPFKSLMTSYSLKQKVQTILHALLEKIEYEEVPNEDDLIKPLRQEAAKWACILDVPTCRDIANRKLERHLTNPERYKILPWWKEWTYCKGLMLKSESSKTLTSTWWATYELGLKISDIKFIEYLACFEYPNLIYQYTYSKDNIWEKYGVNEIYYIFVVITKQGRNTNLLKFLFHNVDDIKLINSVHMNAAITVIINHLYSEKLLNQLLESLEEKVENLRNATIASHEKNNNNYNVTEKIEIDVNIIKHLKEKEHHIQIVTTKLNRRLSEINKQNLLFEIYN